MKLLKILGCIVVFLLILNEPALAVTVEISNLPQNINMEDEATVDVKVTGAQTNTLNYLRGAFFKPDTTSYFGYTLSHDGNWFNGSPMDPKKFLQIQIDASGNWEGQVKVKPDIKDSGFKGNGNYSFKIGRYTENGTSVSLWSNELNVGLEGNEPTPTITPTPTRSASSVQAKTPTPTSTPKATKTPTPFPTSTQKPTITQSLKQSTPVITQETKTKTPIPQSSNSAFLSPTLNNSVLGSKVSKSISPTPKNKDKTNEQISSTNYKMFIVSGVAFLCSACGILAYRKYKKDKEMEI